VSTPAAPQAVHVPVTWAELLRLPDRQFRRLLVDRYRHAATVERTINGALAEYEQHGTIAAARREQVAAMIDAEAARLEAQAQWRYERMAAEFTARIQAGERLHPTLTVDHEEDAA